MPTDSIAVIDSPATESKEHDFGAGESACELQFEQWPSFQSAEPMREEWDALVERIDGDVFSSFDWCAIWWKHFGSGRSLSLFTIRHDGCLVAALPLFRETIRWGPFSLRVVRIVGCDHGVTTCNVVIDPRWIDSVIRELATRISRDARWDMIHFGELPGYSSLGAALAAAFQKCGEVGSVQFVDDAYPHNVFELSGDYETWLGELSTKERRNVRRDERQLEKTPGAMRVEPDRGFELHSAFDDLIRLHDEQWGARGRLGHFGDWQGIEAFHREAAEALAARGRMAMVVVRADGRPIAAEYALRFGRRLHWIIGGRKAVTTSRIGFCALVRNAIRDGVQMIDALPGSYDYKRRLGARTLGVKTIAVFPAGRFPAVRYAIVRGLTKVASLAYHRAWFWHVAPWFRARFPMWRGPLLRAGLWRRFVRARFLVAGRHDSTAEAVSSENSE